MAARDERIQVLFLCTGKFLHLPAKWSEGWARHLKGNSIEAYSAGVEPHCMNEFAVQVMKEAGVDISGQQPKHVDELKNIEFDYVVTVCDHAHETCPIFPATKPRSCTVADSMIRHALARDARNEAEALKHYRRVRMTKSANSFQAFPKH